MHYEVTATPVATPRTTQDCSIQVHHELPRMLSACAARCGSPAAVRAGAALDALAVRKVDAPGQRAGPPVTHLTGRVIPSFGEGGLSPNCCLYSRPLFPTWPIAAALRAAVRTERWLFRTPRRGASIGPPMIFREQFFGQNFDFKKVV